MTNNSPVDTIVLGGIDSFMPHGNTEKSILKSVHSKVEEAIEAQDLKTVTQIGQALLGVGQVSGIAFAEYVYTVEACWNKFNQRDTFWSWAEDKLGKSKTTLERQHRVWAMFVSGDVPKEYVDMFKTMPIRVLIPIANMWNQGYEVTDLQWKKLSSAPDPSSVNKIIREIKGKEVKAGTLQMTWNSEEKSVVGWVNGKPHPIYLTYDDTDDVVQKMLARLFADGKVLEK